MITSHEKVTLWARKRYGKEVRKYDSSEVAAKLFPVLDDPNEEVRLAAARRLVSMTPLSPSLAKELSNSHWSHEQLAAYYLGGTGKHAAFLVFGMSGDDIQTWSAIAQYVTPVNAGIIMGRALPSALAEFALALATPTERVRRGEISLSLDLGQLQSQINEYIFSMTSAPERWHSRLMAVNVREIVRVPEMVRDDIIYLVYVVAEMGWWKETSHIILIFKEDNSGYKQLLSFDGGYNGNGISYRIIDLNPRNKQKELLIEDYASGGQMSRTRTHIYRYDQPLNSFREVFNVLTTFEPSASPFTYSSTLQFEQVEGQEFKDIVIYTDVTKPDYSGKGKDRKYKTKSVFRWNGSRYVTFPICGSGFPNGTWVDRSGKAG